MFDPFTFLAIAAVAITIRKYIFDRVMRWIEPKPKLHWREMDYKYLLALNELNAEFPTYTDEEKGLAKYLEYNSEEDHDRRKEKRVAGQYISYTARESDEVAAQPRSSGGASFSTLLSPGLSQSLGGGLAQLGGGLLGGIGGSLGGLAQQQQSQQQRAFMNAQLQNQLGQPGTPLNNPNPFYGAKNQAEIDAIAQLISQGRGKIGPH